MNSAPPHANDNDPEHGACVSIVRTVVPTGLASSPTPFWMQQIREFELLVIQPHLILHGSSCGSYLEPCGPQEAELWTVVGRYSSGRTEPCRDFATKAEAVVFCDRLASLYPHLVHPT